jgi:hypothetical protein
MTGKPNPRRKVTPALEAMRERYAALLAAGKTVDQIAEAECLAPSTVGVRLWKLGLQTRKDVRGRSPGRPLSAKRAELAEGARLLRELEGLTWPEVGKRLGLSRDYARILAGRYLDGKNKHPPEPTA